MIENIFKRAVWWLMPVGLLAVGFCSSTPPPTDPAQVIHGDPDAVTAAGCGGQVIVDPTTVDERAVFLKPAGTAENLSGGDVVVRLPVGTTPGHRNINTPDFSARDLAINYWQHQIALQLANGQTKTVTVRESADLADVYVGDMVRARITEATTLRLEKT